MLATPQPHHAGRCHLSSTTPCWPPTPCWVYRDHQVIDKEDGSLADYLESAAPEAAWPGPGGPCCRARAGLARPGSGASGYLLHRHERLEQIRATRCGISVTTPRSTRGRRTSTSTLTKSFGMRPEWSDCRPSRTLSADSVARTATIAQIRRATLCLLGVGKLARSVAPARRIASLGGASLSGVEISTLCASRRIQTTRVEAKSASALFTVSREAPTSWSSLCPGAWVTRNAPPSGCRNAGRAAAPNCWRTRAKTYRFER